MKARVLLIIDDFASKPDKIGLNCKFRFNCLTAHNFGELIVSYEVFKIDRKQKFIISSGYWLKDQPK